MGAESGSQKILDAMDKGTRVEQIYEATERLHAAGIEVGFFLQFGYPGRGARGHRATLPHGARVPARRDRHVGLLPAARHQVPPDGCEQSSARKQNWVDSDDLDMMFGGTFTTGFYRQLYRRAAQGVPGAPCRRVGCSGALRARPALRSPSYRLAAGAVYHRLTLPFARLRMRR